MTRRVLGRGAVSRVYGDAWTGDMVPSQWICVFGVILAQRYPWVGFVVLGLSAPFGLAAVTWTARVEGTRVIGRALGVVMLDVGLTADTTVRRQEAGLPRGGTTEVLVLEFVDVRRAWLSRRTDSRVVLGYSRCIGERRREEWREAILSARPEA